MTCSNIKEYTMYSYIITVKHMHSIVVYISRVTGIFKLLTSYQTAQRSTVFGCLFTTCFIQHLLTYFITPIIALKITIICVLYIECDQLILCAASASLTCL